MPAPTRPTGSAAWLETACRRRWLPLPPRARRRPARSTPRPARNGSTRVSARSLGGIDELDRWLGDLVRRGLDSARSEGYRFWDAMGARLVDAQAAGLARSVRGARLGGQRRGGLAAPAARGHGATAPAVRGLPPARRPARGPSVGRPRRLSAGRTREETSTRSRRERSLARGRAARRRHRGQVITARTWLLGEASGRFALHLAFGVKRRRRRSSPCPARLSGNARVLPVRDAAPRRGPAGAGARRRGRSLRCGQTIDEMLAGPRRAARANPFAGPLAGRAHGRGAGPSPGASFLVRHADGAGAAGRAGRRRPALLAVSGGHAARPGGRVGRLAVRPLAVRGGRAAGRPVGAGRIRGPAAAPRRRRRMAAARLGAHCSAPSGRVAFDGSTDPVGGARRVERDRRPERRLLATAA